jgi:type I restriction enzyme S subunit
MNAQQLKNSILQEAIEGRLVPQDPNDEPASVLLDKIRAKKKRLVKEGKLKKKDLEETPISEEEIPFEIPESWEWVRFFSVYKLETNLVSPHLYPNYNHVAPDNIEKGTGRLLHCNLVKDDNVKSNNHLFYKGQIVYSKIRPLLRKAIIAPFDGLCSADMYPLSSEMHSNYALLYLLSDVFNKQVSSICSSRVKMPKINKDELSTILVPLPPLAEQKRIVAKIEELLPKVEDYGKAQESLDKLNEELSDRLKKSILQEAVEGRLVPQDPNDETASVLLDKIRKEKAKLVKEGKLKKKDLEETPISENEKSFDIPKHWGLVRLGEITYNHGQKTPTEDFSYIDIGSIDNEHQKLNMTDNIIKAKDAPSRARKIVKRGDVLYATVRPYLHNLCIIDRDFDKEPIASTGFAVLSCINGVYNKFLFYYLLSPVFDAYANDGDNAKGMAYPAINDKKLYNGLVPIPPLAEQKRIVAKIEQLMKEINKLKV